MEARTDSRANDQNRVRERLAKQLELIGKASELAFRNRQFDNLARLSEAMGMVANSYLIQYGMDEFTESEVER